MVHLGVDREPAQASALCYYYGRYDVGQGVRDIRVRQRRHSFGGIAPVRDRQNPSYRTPVRNLWFAGSQSEGGGGVLGVMKGARAAARAMSEQ